VPSRRRRLAAAVGVLLALGVAVDAWLFVLPAGDAPAPADAIVVLGGPGLRVEMGERLVAERWADILVLATDTPSNCRPDVPVRAQYCFHPDPDTTQGEARAVAGLGREYGWQRIVVVAQNEQVRRARLRLDRCLPAGVGVRMIGVRATLLASVWRAVYETGALPKALLLQRSC
jgi:uncharacterized SAM-binding protein YcdF (DUF218 family)